MLFLAEFVCLSTLSTMIFMIYAGIFLFFVIFLSISWKFCGDLSYISIKSVFLYRLENSERVWGMERVRQSVILTVRARDARKKRSECDKRAHRLESPSARPGKRIILLSSLLTVSHPVLPGEDDTLLGHFYLALFFSTFSSSLILESSRYSPLSVHSFDFIDRR